MPAIRMVAIYIYIYIIWWPYIYIYIYIIYGHHTYSWHVLYIWHILYIYIYKGSWLVVVILYSSQLMAGMTTRHDIFLIFVYPCSLL